MPPPPTARLQFRCLVATDAPFLVRLFNDPDFLAHIGDKKVRDDAQAAAWVTAGPAASHARHGFALDAVTLAATGEPIGICGLLQRDHFPGPDLGYAYLPAHRGRGYATEAGAAALAHGQRAFGLRRILAVTAPDNDASIRVLARLGFRDAGTTSMPDSTGPSRLFAWTAPDAPTPGAGG